jgi:hypothetical protein
MVELIKREGVEVVEEGGRDVEVGGGRGRAQ